MLNINQIRDSVTGHIPLNEDNLKKITEYTNLMNDFRFLRTQEEQENNMKAVISALTFEK